MLKTRYDNKKNISNTAKNISGMYFLITDKFNRKYYRFHPKYQNLVSSHLDPCVSALFYHNVGQ
jgi:hypothetical protein